MTTLEKRMVLHRFMCDQFGYKNLREMLSRLDGLPKGFMGDNTSRFCQALATYLDPYSKETTKDDLARYDENIIAHSQTLGMTDDKGKSWKPFQYLALLFTERYLDLYFQDTEILIEKLNRWIKNDSATNIPEYTADDIRTLAFQSATGSGKTLLLHANILQYKHYLEANKRLHKLNKIILVTPDEGLSRQHLRELQASNIPAQLFSDHQEAGVFSHRGAVVDIIDLHKLAEKKGIKRVALESFEENNLVLVDEGHLGTGGKVWRDYRKQLAKNGFTFEYSATFNQAVAGSTDEIKKLRDEYGKSILFDYSYKFFYEDGYGKDYHITNLAKTDDTETNRHYLLACLLVFYQQCRIYEDKGGQWRDFNIAPPLWVFLGKTVTGGKLSKDAETDVIRIMRFLAWVASDQQQAVKIIKRLTSGTTGLNDENDVDIFSKSFSYIKDTKPQGIYDALCALVFHGKGQLHITHLTGLDELQLSAGDGTPFGVIKVGDASGFYTKLEAIKNGLFSVSKSAFNKPLFEQVDNNNSPVNIVIGARKFAAGWNSWRVSTMGLMHVGTGEGPQIIQMFGRGVRLKGYDMSLKRHSVLEVASPQDGEQLKLLETLNIFGLKANYMDKFKEYLQKEGVKVDRVTFRLPTKKQFGKIKDLKILKKQDSAGEFQYSDIRLDLPKTPSRKDFVTLDRYKHLQVLESGKNQTTNASDRQDLKLKEKHLDLLNKQTIYHKVLERKRRFSWHNLRISRETVDALLENEDWYNLHIPPEKLEFSEYGRVREWENLAVDLISEYANQYWRAERNKWEHKHLDVVPLDDENPNYVEEYVFSVDAKETALIESITKLVARVKGGDATKNWDFGNVKISLWTPNFHAYIPLLYANAQNFVQITPVPLNDGEVKFVEYLETIAKNKEGIDCLKGKEIYLMRNMSRGKGISFFDDYAFYPDFILWVKNSKRQDILFIDPKGLVHGGRVMQSKMKLHKEIKKTEKRIKQENPGLFLHSYIWSVTRFENIEIDGIESRADCRKKGIVLAEENVPGIINLLEQALK